MYSKPSRCPQVTRCGKWKTSSSRRTSPATRRGSRNGISECCSTISAVSAAARRCEMSSIKRSGFERPVSEFQFDICTELLLHDQRSLRLRFSLEPFAQPPCHRSWHATADRPPVDFDHRRQLSHPSLAKHFFGPVDFGERQVFLLMWDALLPADLQHRGAGDSFRTSCFVAGPHHSPVDEKDVRCVCLGDKAA